MSINAELIKKLENYIQNKITVTLQVKDLEWTIGLRHLPESQGGEANKYITGKLYGTFPNFSFLEDGKDKAQYILKESLSKIQPYYPPDRHSYKEKYLKYKQKYLNLKNQYGGAESSTWTCSICTLINPISALNCMACNTPRNSNTGVTADSSGVMPSMQSELVPGDEEEEVSEGGDTLNLVCISCDKKIRQHQDRIHLFTGGPMHIRCFFDVLQNSFYSKMHEKIINMNDGDTTFSFDDLNALVLNEPYNKEKRRQLINMWISKIDTRKNIDFLKIAREKEFYTNFDNDLEANDLKGLTSMINLGLWYRCPKCGFAYSESSGCNTFRCPWCDIYFCSICLATFEEDKVAHEHVKQEHTLKGVTRRQPAEQERALNTLVSMMVYIHEKGKGHLIDKLLDMISYKRDETAVLNTKVKKEHIKEFIKKAIERKDAEGGDKLARAWFQWQAPTGSGGGGGM